MGYEMFRLLATCKTKTRKRKVNAGPELIDIDLEEKNSGLQSSMLVSNRVYVRSCVTCMLCGWYCNV